MKKLVKWIGALAVMVMVLVSANVQEVQAASNPYPMTQDVDGDGNYEVPCTRFAWQQVYDNQGIALPAWGNAVNWWQSAINAGYSTGNQPKAGAIAVWSGDYYGHVAYVTSGSGNTFTVNEGGRTDLDHTSSHGVKYGYTLTNAVGASRPYDSNKTLLGFIYPGSKTPAQNPWVEIRGVTETSATEAKLNGYIRNPGGVYITTVGVYVWDAKNNLIKEHYEEIDPQSHTRDGVDMWFYMNAELGINVQTNTKYKYQMFVICSNGTFYTDQLEYSTIPPKWYESQMPVNPDLGVDFYAEILKYEGWVHIGNTDGNVEVTGNAAKDGSDIWHFIRQGDGSYEILNCLDHKALTVQNSGQADGTNIIVSEWKGTDNQKWFIYGRWSGEYVLRPKYSDKVLDVFNGNNTVGTNVHLWSYTSNNSAQMMAIYEADKAGKSVLSAETADSSSKITLSWSEAVGAAGYRVLLYKGSKGDVSQCDEIDVGNNTSYEMVLPEGYYEAVINSYNRFSQEMSNTVSFTIEEKESEPSDTGTSDTPNIKPSDKETSDTPNTKPSGTKPSVTPSKKPSVIKKKVTVQKPTGLKLNNIKKRKVKITWKKAKKCKWI